MHFAVSPERTSAVRVRRLAGKLAFVIRTTATMTRTAMSDPATRAVLRVMRGGGAGGTRTGSMRGFPAGTAAAGIGTVFSATGGAAAGTGRGIWIVFSDPGPAGVPVTG